MRLFYISPYNISPFLYHNILYIIHIKIQIIIFINTPPNPTSYTKPQQQMFSYTSLITKLSNLPIFLPVSTGMILWYFTIMITILFNFFLTIIFICFRSPSAQFIIRNIIAPILILLCTLDILMSLNTSFIQRGKLITNKSIIKQKYIKSIYFIFDIIALIIVICQQILRNYFQNKLPFLNLLIFIKVFKVNNFDTLIKKYVIKSSNILLYYQIIKHFILLIMVCHIIGSLFFYLDVKLIQAQWDNQDDLWVYSAYAYNGIIQLQIVWQYAYSFYYAVVTLSGTAYGDLTPLNPTQVAFTFFSLVLPMLVYAYLFSVVYSAIGQRRNRQKQAKEYKKIATNYFKQAGISEIESAKFVNYLSYAFVKKLSVDNNYLDQLAPSTKEAYIRDSVDTHFDWRVFQVLYDWDRIGNEQGYGNGRDGNGHENNNHNNINNPMNSNHINNNIHINNKLQTLKQIIYTCTQQQVYPAKQLFNLQKQKKQKLYFIISGTISQYIQMQQIKFNKILKNTQFYGQYTFYTNIAPAKYNHLYQTNQFTICQTILYRKFIDKIKQSKNMGILEMYHNVRNIVMYGYRNGKENENEKRLELIRSKCFFCQSKQHIIDKCPRLKISINPIQSSCKYNTRNRIHKRKQQKRHKYYQLQQMKQVRQAANMFKCRGQSQVLYEDQCVQTVNVDWMKQVAEMRKRKRVEWVGIDIVQNWRVFQKEYSFD